jgi:hypothetical protein
MFQDPGSGAVRYPVPETWQPCNCLQAFACTLINTFTHDTVAYYAQYPGFHYPVSFPAVIPAA